MRELENDVTDLMTRRHLHVNGSLITRGRPALTVADLIELLGAYDPGEEVFVLDSCDCCLTGLAELTPACVGLRDAFLDDMFDPDKSVDELIDAHEQAPRLSPLPLPPSRWLRRGVVIAGAPWVHYPDVTGAAAERVAALPGARHIDAELITTMAGWRAWKERNPAGFDAWRRAGMRESDDLSRCGGAEDKA